MVVEVAHWLHKGPQDGAAQGSTGWGCTRVHRMAEKKFENLKGQALPAAPAPLE